VDKELKARLEKIAKKMTQGHFTLDELGTSMTEIRMLRDMGYQILNQAAENGRVYYIGSPDESPYLFVSKASRDTQHIKFLELSDIHAGSKMFDEQGLRDVLQRALDDGYVDAHISGDLVDGNKLYRGQQKNLRYWRCEDQADYLAEILMEYDLNYVAVKGNHDESYEKVGSPNPIRLIEMRMREEDKNFVFLDSMAGDLVIAGVVKRMVHLDGGRAYAKSYPGQTYLRNLFDSHGEDVWIRGNKYRLRFGQFGHFHSNIMYEASGVYCTHPGNFQFPNDYTTRRGLVGDQGARFTEFMIENRHIYEYSSKFVKPKRPCRS